MNTWRLDKCPVPIVLRFVEKGYMCRFTKLRDGINVFIVGSIKHAFDPNAYNACNMGITRRTLKVRYSSLLRTSQLCPNRILKLYVLERY